MAETGGTGPRNWLIGGAIVALVVSGFSTWAGILEGATTKDVLIGLSTGLLTGALVSVPMAVLEHIRANREREQDQRDREWSETVQTRLALIAAVSLEGVVLKPRADLTGIRLRGKNLRGAVLRSVILTGADLTDCDLRDADLAGVTAFRVALARTRLQGAWLQRGQFMNAQARGADFSGAFLDEATDFSGADLRALDDKPTSFKDAVICDPWNWAKDEPSLSLKEAASMNANEAQYSASIEWPINQRDVPAGAKLVT